MGNYVGGTIAGVTFTRPADTTAYASGDLVANSTTAGSVVPIAFALVNKVPSTDRVDLLRARLFKSTTTTTNASFRLHLYSASPTIANGDNAAWSTTVTAYLGAFDITVDRAGSAGSVGDGVSTTGTPISVDIAAATNLYGLLEARAAYSPGNAETFTATLEVVG